MMSPKPWLRRLGDLLRRRDRGNLVVTDTGIGLEKRKETDIIEAANVQSIVTQKLDLITYEEVFIGFCRQRQINALVRRT